MTTLSVVSVDRSHTVDHTEPEAIRAALAAIGVGYERWEADRPLAPDATSEDILAAYAAPIARLTERHGFRSVDVVRMHPEHPGRGEARAKFRAEHTHADFEVRFFVEGTGRFYLHVDGHVYVVTCTAGDLLAVPPGTRHWFDMGERPRFCAIRLFTSPDGWVATFTGSPIASGFPELPT